MSKLSMEGWYSEKTARLVREIARAMVAARHIADPDVRSIVHGDLHAALGQAMTLASMVHGDPALYSIARVDAISADPELALEWCRDLDERVGSERLGSLTASVAAQLDSARRWRNGERPKHWTDTDKDEETP